MTTSKLSLLHAELFRKHNIVVSLLKHLTPKTILVTGFLKCGLPFF